MPLVDVDGVDAQMRVSRLTSRNRFNWASFDDRDHLGDPAQPLRQRLAADARAHGFTLPGGPLYLLTHLRYLGYNFNPISLIFAYGHGGRLELMGGEVRNTFGGLCTYWWPASEGPTAGAGVRHRTAKVMHVSPFMPMHLDYEFIVTPPGPTLIAHMNTFDRRDDADRPNFDATLTLERRPWTPREIRRALIRQPAMTAQVVAAIHWEALRLWWKGLPFYPNPDDVPSRSRSRQEA
jgi:DUF1365 family protein